MPVLALALVCLFVTSFALAEAPVVPAASAPVAVEAPEAQVGSATAQVVGTPVVEAPAVPVALAEAVPATDAEAVAQAKSAFDAFQAGQILLGLSLLLGALYFFYKKYGSKKS